MALQEAHLPDLQEVSLQQEEAHLPDLPEVVLQQEVLAHIPEEFLHQQEEHIPHHL